MIVLGPALIVGMVAGFFIRRWSLVAAMTVIGIAASLVSWQTGWAPTRSEWSSVGGAIAVAGIWIPLAIGAGLGVYYGLDHQHKRQR